MTEAINFRVEDGVAVVPLTEAGLGAEARQDLMEALDQAEEDDLVRAILLLREDDGAALGIPPSDKAAGSDAPSLRDLCKRITVAEKPVLAALDGEVLGAGLEIALAARFRIAGPTLRIGAPELRFGILPGAGLTQLLPRLIGSDRAMRLMLTGKRQSPREPDLEGIFDVLADGPVRQTALLFAKTLPEGRPLVQEQTKGFKDMVAYQKAIVDIRKKMGSAPRDAMAKLVDLVEAAPLLPVIAGMKMAHEAFLDSLESQDSAALRHLTGAEMRLSQAMVRGRPRRQVVALIGANAVAVQVAAMLIQSGHTLRWGIAMEDRRETARRALADLPGMTPERLGTLMTGAPEEAALGAQAVFVATQEMPSLTLPPDVPVVDLVPGPHAPLGLRFPMPLRGGRVVEKLLRPEAIPDHAAWLDSFIGQMGRIAVPVTPGMGSLVQRMTNVLHRAADSLLDLGATPYQIDMALVAWGFTRGPFLQRDILALSSFSKAPRAIDATNWSMVLERAGREGRVAQQGFYDWSSGRPAPSETVREILRQQRADVEWTSEDLVRLMLGALANEGARFVQSEVVANAGDLDVLMTDALGLDRQRGGIMYAAGPEGMLTTMRAMRGIDHRDKALWTPVPLWEDLIKNGRTFAAS